MHAGIWRLTLSPHVGLNIMRPAQYGYALGHWLTPLGHCRQQPLVERQGVLGP